MKNKNKKKNLSYKSVHSRPLFYLAYCLYSLYFFELPLTRSFGYFFLFFSTLSSKAFDRSIPQTSLSLIKYDKTSASSYPTWVFYFSENSGRPFWTYPFHWNISLIYPTSPTKARTRFLGVWKSCHSLSSTNPLIMSRIWFKFKESWLWFAYKAISDDLAWS